MITQPSNPIYRLMQEGVYEATRAATVDIFRTYRLQVGETEALQQAGNDLVVVAQSAAHMLELIRLTEQSIDKAMEIKP